MRRRRSRFAGRPQRAQVIYANKNWNTSVQGVGASYPEVRNWQLEAGAFFDASEVIAAAKVCVLGATVAKRSSRTRIPSARSSAQGSPFPVIGVLKPRASPPGSATATTSSSCPTPRS